MKNIIKIVSCASCAVSTFALIAVNNSGSQRTGATPNLPTAIPVQSVSETVGLKQEAAPKTKALNEQEATIEKTTRVPDQVVEFAGKAPSRKVKSRVQKPVTSTKTKQTVALNIPSAIPVAVTRPVPRQSVKPAVPTTMKPRNISGTKEIRFDRPQRIQQWGDVYLNLLSQTNDLKHCVNYTRPCSDSVLRGWADQIRPLKNLSRNERVQAVNNLVNQRPFRTDLSQYGKKDHWAAPTEFLTSSGDCEDYAILKYASLMALGLDNQDLRLVVGNITGIGSHAFLAVNMHGQEILLDNRTTYLSAAATRFDFQPKHSMNLTYRWVHVSGTKKSQSI